MTEASGTTVWVEREALLDRIPRWLAMAMLFAAFLLVWDLSLIHI